MHAKFVNEENRIRILFFLKGRIKPKKFKTLISILNETPGLHNNIVPFDFLRVGENDNVTYRGTVVASLGVQDVKLYSFDHHSLFLNSIFSL